MNKFAEYKNLNLTETAKTIAEFWKNNDTFKKSVEIRQGQPEFVFYELTAFRQRNAGNSPRYGKSD